MLPLFDVVGMNSKIFYYSRQIKMGGGSRDYIHVPVAEQKHMHVAH